MKKIAGILMITGLLLLTSCNSYIEEGPVNVTNGAPTPTVVVPTCTPGVTQTPVPTSAPKPTAVPEATPTEAVEPTVSPMPTSTPEPTKAEVVEATPTNAPEPTVSPEPTPVPEITEEPAVSPEPTIEPEPSQTPEATPSPTPYINPETLVNAGWQKNISIDEKIIIVFPELFRESTVAKENNDLILSYTCPEDESIEFRISYLMQRTLQEVENEILSMDGTLLEGSLAEKKVVLEWQEDAMVYRGILLEEQYAQALLGTSFGDEEWITGVMQVTFAYPEERRSEYETADYCYYIMQNREE